MRTVGGGVEGKLSNAAREPILKWNQASNGCTRNALRTGRVCSPHEVYGCKDTTFFNAIQMIRVDYQHFNIFSGAD